jgi:hypothetical protein
MVGWWVLGVGGRTQGAYRTGEDDPDQEVQYCTIHKFIHKYNYNVAST